jgi:hypothetical protein
MRSAERQAEWMEAMQEAHELYDAVDRVMRRTHALRRDAAALRGGAWSPAAAPAFGRSAER